MYKRIIAKLDEIANTIEDKGFLREAEEIDIISNTLQPGKPSLQPGKPFLSDIRELLNDPIVRELEIEPTDVPKNKEDAAWLFQKAFMAQLRKEAADKQKVLMSILLSLINGVAGPAVASQATALFNGIKNKPNAEFGRKELDFIKRSIS